MSKIKCVVFDSDGVVNPFPTKKFSDRFVEDFPEQICVMDFFKDGAYKKCRKGESSVEREFPKYLDGTDWTLESILNYWHEGDRGVDENMLKYIEFLRRHGVVVVLATNQAACRTKYMLEDMGLGKYFDKIIASCDIFCEKPEREFYEKCQKFLFDKYGIRNDELLFFDDKEENVIAGKEFGWVNSFLYKDYDEFLSIMKSKLDF